MRKWFSSWLRSVFAFCAVACVTIACGPSAHAQSGLSVGLYSGLTITGVVGTVYEIQYREDLVNTNNWLCLTVIKPPVSPYVFADTAGPAANRRFYRTVEIQQPTNMVFIPPGTFTMGSPADEVDRDVDEGPQTVVTLTRGYFIGKYLVTQAEYLAVMSNNPSYFVGNSNLPVESLDYYDASAYCQQLTQRELLAGRLPAGWAYRLPTEAEWEYACRAGTTTRFTFGDDPGYMQIGSYAWYYANSSNTTHPVGLKLPNPWGLYDLPGNVWEWCLDWYDWYPGGNVTDPTGPAVVFLEYRVLRGGSWEYFPNYCRSANRYFDYESNRYNDYGVRVVLAPD